MTRAYKVWQLDGMIVPIKKGHAPWAVGKNRKDRPPEVYMDELADLTFEVLDILENGALLQIYSSEAGGQCQASKCRFKGVDTIVVRPKTVSPFYLFRTQQNHRNISLFK